MSGPDRDVFEPPVPGVERLPRSIEPPRDLWPGVRARIAGRRHARRWLVAIAAAAAVTLVVFRVADLRVGGTWLVTALAGAPRVGAAPVAQRGRLAEGDVLETGVRARARVDVGAIGFIEVEPSSVVRLLAARAEEHRIALDVGEIYARVEAPPRLFYVETPSATAIDLGCAYTLVVDSAGNGYLRVTAGIVELAGHGRRALVPLGAQAETRTGAGPGTPVVGDAADALRAALTSFDFAGGGAIAVRAALAAARAEDALSLWHLVQRADPGLRPAVYDRLAALVPPPGGVERAAAVALHAATLERYWAHIRRIAWRRAILEGVRDIDPRTGLAR